MFVFRTDSFPTPGCSRPRRFGAVFRAKFNATLLGIAQQEAISFKAVPGASGFPPGRRGCQHSAEHRKKITFRPAAEKTSMFFLHRAFYASVRNVLRPTVLASRSLPTAAISAACNLRAAEKEEGKGESGVRQNH